MTERNREYPWSGFVEQCGRQRLKSLPNNAKRSGVFAFASSSIRCRSLYSITRTARITTRSATTNARR